MTDEENSRQRNKTTKKPGARPEVKPQEGQGAVKTGKRRRKEKRMTLGSNWVVLALSLETGNTGRGSSWQWGNHEVNFGHVELRGTLGHLGRAIAWESGYIACVKRYLWARDKTTADTCEQTVTEAGERAWVKIPTRDWKKGPLANI